MKLLIVVILVLFSTPIFSQTKLVGTVVTDIAHVKEVKSFVNTVLYQPDNLDQLKQYLIASNGLNIIIGINRYFFTGSVFISKDVSQLAQIINTYRGNNKIILEYDEPFWNTRLACMQGKQDACYEVNTNYAKTISNISRINYNLKRAIPGVEIMHVESYLELYNQYTKLGRLILIKDAKHIGFDCYSKPTICKIPSTNVSISHMQFFQILIDQIQKQGIQAKLILVPGTYISTVGDINRLRTEDEVINNLSWYIDVFKSYPSYVSGIGAFLWSDISPQQSGARSMPKVKLYLQQKFPELF